MKKYVIIVFVGMMMLVSCGSRKTNRSKSKDESKSKIELQVDLKASETSKVENDINHNTSSVTENKSEEKENHMKPVDPNKPMKRTETVNGNTKTTTWENAEVSEKSKTKREKKAEESNFKDKSVLSSDSSFVASVDLELGEESSSENLNSKTDAQRGFGYWWFAIIIIILFISLYLKRKWKSIT